MRTKALLLTAMLGVAGIASSYAQNVYSVNVVGYVTLKLTNQFTMVANQLDNGAGNLVTNMFTGMPNSTVIYKYNPATAGYVQLTYVSPAVGWTPTANRTMTLAPGEGVFVKKPTTATEINVTFTGEVLEGDLVNPVVLGFDMYSGMVPQEGGLVTVHRYVPANLDVVYQYTGAGYLQRTWNASLNRWLPVNTEPLLKVGEAFWIKAASAKNWTRTFTVPRE